LGGEYQDFEDTVDGRAAVAAKVVSDVLATGTLLVETLGFALGELDRARGKNDIRRKRTTSFLLARLAMADSLFTKSIPVPTKRGGADLEDRIPRNLVLDISAKTRSVISNHFQFVR
jgi:hypothetical protein